MYIHWCVFVCERVVRLYVCMPRRNLAVYTVPLRNTQAITLLCFAIFQTPQGTQIACVPQGAAAGPQGTITTSMVATPTASPAPAATPTTPTQKGPLPIAPKPKQQQAATQQTNVSQAPSQTQQQGISLASPTSQPNHTAKSIQQQQSPQLVQVQVSAAQPTAVHAQQQQHQQQQPTTTVQLQMGQQHQLSQLSPAGAQTVFHSSQLAAVPASADASPQKLANAKVAQVVQQVKMQSQQVLTELPLANFCLRFSLKYLVKQTDYQEQ